MSQTAVPSENIHRTSVPVSRKKWTQFKEAFEGYLYLSPTMIIFAYHHLLYPQFEPDSTLWQPNAVCGHRKLYQAFNEC